MKKIHISESKLKENFNEALEPMSDLEKEFKNFDSQQYNDYSAAQLIDNDDDDNIVMDGSIPDDELEAKVFIKERLVEAQDIIEDLIDYLTNSDYAIQKGGDLFKAHLAKATDICNQLKNFF